MQAPTIDTLFGRDDEVATLEAFLDDIASGPSTLILEGDVGAGKSALWRAAVAAARSRDHRVLTSRATEAEASLAFAALGDLLRDVPEAALSDLPTPQATAPVAESCLSPDSGSGGTTCDPTAHRIAGANRPLPRQ